MKIFSLVLFCSLVCVACSRPLRTLSDGQPGYVVTCDTVRERCIKEIVLACRGKSYAIVAERAQELILPTEWVDTGGNPAKFNSRYWMEARCDQF